jgi:hypothetical protein
MRRWDERWQGRTTSNSAAVEQLRASRPRLISVSLSSRLRTPHSDDIVPIFGTKTRALSRRTWAAAAVLPASALARCGDPAARAFGARYPDGGDADVDLNRSGIT